MAKEIVHRPQDPNRYADAITDWVQQNRGRAQTDIMAWRPPQQHADSEFVHDRGLASGRSRQVAWQEPYGANAMRLLRDNVIGKSYRLSLSIDADALGISEEKAHEWEQRAEREWIRYAEGPWFGSDAARKNTFTFLMHQVLAGLTMDGEAFAIVALKRGWEGYLTCLHLIEPERVSDPPQNVLDKAIELRNGVEIDRMGEPIAYWIRKEYPGTRGSIYRTKGKSDEHERVLRMTEWGRPVVLHLYDEDRMGMTRGLSAFVSALKQIKMLGAYSDTELERATMSASFAAVIESDMDYEQAMRVLGAEGGDTWGNNLTAAAMAHMKTVAPYHQQVGLRYNGARVAHLLPGEQLKVVQAPLQGTQYDVFERAMVRQLAAGLGVAAESLSRDFSNTSYSSARMSLGDIWRSHMVRRQLMNMKFAMPFVGAWMEEAILEGYLPMPDGSEPTLENWVARRHAIVRGDFLSWGKPIIDPVKEREGQQKALALGLTTLEEEAGAEGKDWDEVLRQRKQEKDRRDELGLNVLDLDPTLSYGPMGSAAASQNASQNPNSDTAE